MGGLALLVVLAGVVLSASLAVGFGNRNDKDGRLETNFTKATGLDRFKLAVNQTNFFQQLLDDMMMDPTNDDDDDDDTNNAAAATYTIWAPLDASFENNKVVYVGGDDIFVKHLQVLLWNQVTRNKLFAAVLRGNQSIVMASGNTYQASPTSISPVAIGSGVITQPDLVTPEGFVVHAMDGFLEADFLHKDGIQVALENNLTEIVDWVQRAGFGLFLVSVADFTVFLPNNQAMEAVDADTEAYVFSNPSLLLDTMTGHIVASVDSLYYSDIFTEGDALPAVAGDPLVIGVSPDGRQATVSKGGMTANIVQTDLLPYNGVMHVIDKFFLPPVPS